jgi:hypothetical protein
MEVQTPFCIVSICRLVKDTTHLSGQWQANIEQERNNDKRKENRRNLEKNMCHCHFVCQEPHMTLPKRRSFHKYEVIILLPVTYAIRKLSWVLLAGNIAVYDNIFFLKINIIPGRIFLYYLKWITKRYVYTFPENSVFNVCLNLIVLKYSVSTSRRK